MHVRPYRGILPTLGERAWVDPTALVIGEVTLGEDASVWPMSVIRGDVNRVVIGARSNVQDGSVLHVSSPTAANPGGHPLLVGDDVTIGHKVVVHGCTIGDRCLIGIGAIVLDGAVLEPEVMVGAGCVVPPGKRLLAGGLYLGSPARRARDLGDAEREGFAKLAARYVSLKDEYAKAGS